MLWEWDDQGRVCLGKDVAKKCDFEVGDKIVFQEVDEKKFRILSEKNAATEEVLALSLVSVDAKGRFFLPTMLRAKFKNEFRITYKASEKSVYITFFDFAE